MSITAGIPFSRWGAEPFIIGPFAYPAHAAQAAQLAAQPLDVKRDLHPFELAFAWKEQLAGDKKLTKAAIASREGLSRARITQIMKLLELPEEIQMQLRNPPGSLSIHDFSERRLRLILSVDGAVKQIQQWTALLNELKS